jgi:dTDP-4-amino-4,6-dideoxygalactose transaminase
MKPDPGSPAQGPDPMPGPIPVTRPSLPPLDAFIPYLQTIWNKRQLTNGGPYSQELEQALCDHLGVAHVSLFASGTTALLVALQCLELTGEVITTPYSFVASANALLWRGLRPVFTDIDPTTFNLDPARIEAAITPQTTAIMPVHCYGYPCDVDAIAEIARRHRLRVVYDAAHAFGVNHQGSSLLNHGDLSVLSLHATKVFSTFEGGAIISHDMESKRRIDALRNFGIVDELTLEGPGLNGKLNEVAAAFGLLLLQHVNEAIERNRIIDARYRAGLAGIPGLQCPPVGPGSNGAYFALRVKDDYGESRDELHARLHRHGILARRYFYPLLPDFPLYAQAVSGPLDAAREAAARVVCLPIYPDLPLVEVDRIISLIWSPHGEGTADGGRRPRR